jgi:hypothetical protein
MSFIVSGEFMRPGTKFVYCPGNPLHLETFGFLWDGEKFSKIFY